MIIYVHIKVTYMRHLLTGVQTKVLIIYCTVYSITPKNFEYFLSWLRTVEMSGLYLTVTFQPAMRSITICR